MVTSIAIHAFLFSLGVNPSPEAGRRTGAALDTPGSRTSSNAPAGLRITRIVVAEPGAQPEFPETAAEEPLPELAEPELEDSPPPKLDDPPHNPGLAPGDPSPTGQPDLPRASGLTTAARLKPHFTNPALWRRISDPASPGGAILHGRVEGGGSRYTPPDTWAFNIWTTRDAAGRFWSVTPGSIYLAGFGIRTCGGRFDASNCGFGLPGWKRRQYQRFLQAAIEIENQQRWRGIMERDRAIRERRGAERDPKMDSIPDGTS